MSQEDRGKQNYQSTRLFSALKTVYCRVQISIENSQQLNELLYLKPAFFFNFNFEFNHTVN